LAFDKTPSQSTYQTKTIRLVRELNSRGTSTSKDEDYVNFYPELIKNRNTKENELFLVKRDGSTQFIASVGATDIRGMHFWEEQNQLFVATSDDIYIYNGTSAAIITTLNTAFTTTTGAVGFCEFLYDNGTVKVVATDGTTLMTIDSAGTKDTGVPDPDLPTHLPYPVFLDGYLFILKAGTADIYNSDLNDPLVYTAGNFRQAEMAADKAQYLRKINNYILVFGSASIEYFWDAAGTTSPLERYDAALKLTGILGGYAAIGNKVFFIGSDNESVPDIFLLEDLKKTPIGTDAIRRHLGSITIANVTTIKAAVISRSGHDLYVFNTGSACYAYDIESKLWTRLTWQASSNFALTQAVNAVTGGGYKTFFSLSGDSAIYRFDSSLYQDNGTTFPCICVTDREEFDTFNQKTMSRVIVWADKASSSSHGLLQWTDDDYQSFSAGLDVDLFDELPSTQRLGRFRRRAFKWTYTQDQPHRLQSFEVDINMGQT
jgi:hypothetical protein